MQLINDGLDGVMVGREAYQAPLLLADVDSIYYGHHKNTTTESELKHQLQDWIIEKTNDGVPLKYLARHMLGLFAGRPGARKYRRHLSENMTKDSANAQTFIDAMSFIVSD